MEGNNFHLQGLVQIFLHLATSFCFTFFYLYAHKCYYFKSIIFVINFFMKKEEVCVNDSISYPHAHFLL